MSSGVEVLLFLPFLMSAGGGAGGATAGAAAASTATTGSAIGGAIGAPVITTSAASAGGTGAVGAGASGAAGTSALAGAASVAIIVAGAAGIALLAAYGMSQGYEAALCAHRTRIEAQQKGFRTTQQHSRDAALTALGHVGKSRVQASESAELVFLQAGVKRLRQRLSGWPGVDPRLPDGCVHLESALEGFSPDLKALFISYEALVAAIAKEATQRRARLAQAATAAGNNAASVEALRAATQSEVESLRQDIEAAPDEVLATSIRTQLQQMLAQVEHLAVSQPQMAEQGLQMLRGRINRALLEGSEQAARQRAEQERAAAALRELSAHISARCQAVLSALEPQEIRTNSLNRSQIEALQTSALTHLKKLATLLAGELPSDMAPLERLSKEADALFESTQKQLENMATQIYLQEQVADVFTQLGYRVTLNEAPKTTTNMIATLDAGHGVEVSWDKEGHLHSELVAFSSNSSEFEPASQEKVCALMDEVFDALRARGCGVREKKRRHYRKGEHRLRVVDAPSRKAEAPASLTTPIARQIGD